MRVRVGEDWVGAVDVPATGGWSAFSTVTIPTVALDQGPAVRVRVQADRGNFNLDWLRADAAALPFADGDALTFENLRGGGGWWLDADYDASTNRVDLANVATGGDRKWLLRSRGNGWYRLESDLFRGQFLDADYWSGVNRADLRGADGGADVEWKFVEVSSGVYALQSRQYGRYLSAGAGTSGGSADTASGFASADQRWRVRIV